MIIDAFGQPTKQSQADSGYLSAQARRSFVGREHAQAEAKVRKEGLAKYPEFERIARAVDLLWMPVRIAAVSGRIYWATWHQVFRYPRGDE